MAFNFSINPQSLQSEKIDTPDHQRQFLFKLSQLLSQICNDLNQLSASTLTPVIMNSSSATLSVSCGGASLVYLSWNPGGAGTLSLTNLASGVPVFIRHIGGVAQNITLTATNPSGTAYTVNGNKPGTSTTYGPASVGFGPSNNWPNNPLFIWGMSGLSTAGAPELSLITM